MGKMKELFMEYQEQMNESNSDLIDDEFYFQKWVQAQVDNTDWSEELETQFWSEQPPYPFATNIELDEINSRIQIKYSDTDIQFVLQKILGDGNPLANEIKNELNNLNSIKNGYFN